MTDSERTAAQYDAMAVEYSEANDDGVFNSLYERPAMLALLGDVAESAVLDLGCGAGQLTGELVERGARVTGADVSPAMIELARSRVGNRAELVVTDAAKPLPFEPDSFDIVVGSLMMHYIADWVPVLTDIGRVLRPGGSFVFSTHHPSMDWLRINPDDYFAKKQITETWTKGGAEFDVTFWRRPLSAMSREIAEAGFVIDEIVEPMPEPSLAEIDVDNHDYLTTNPHFLFLRVRPDESA